MGFKLQEKERLVEAAKSDLLMGLKTREVSFCKLKLGKFVVLCIRVFHPYNMMHRVGFLLFFLFFFFPYTPTLCSVKICKKREKNPGLDGLSEIEFHFLFLRFLWIIGGIQFFLGWSCNDRDKNIYLGKKEEETHLCCSSILFEFSLPDNDRTPSTLEIVSATGPWIHSIAFWSSYGVTFAISQSVNFNKTLWDIQVPIERIWENLVIQGVVHGHRNGRNLIHMPKGRFWYGRGTTHVASIQIVFSLKLY